MSASMSGTSRYDQECQVGHQQNRIVMQEADINRTIMPSVVSVAAGAGRWAWSQRQTVGGHSRNCGQT